MSMRDESALRHMLAHCEEAMAFVSGRSRTDLDDDRLLALALVQLAQIVGEAAARVSEAEREATPKIPWTEIVALRNRLIHGYDTIDYDILWAILVADFPQLGTDLTRRLQALDGNGD